MDEETELLVQLEVDIAEVTVLKAESIGFLSRFVKALEAEAVAIDQLLAVLDEQRLVEFVAI